MRATIIGIAIAICASIAYAEDTECASPSACRPQCTAGNQSACEWLGEYYTRAPDMADTPQYASIGIALLEAACTKTNREACTQLARALRDAALIAMKDPDLKRIDQLRATACKAGDGVACDDDKQRIAALEQQCTAGGARACLSASREYGGVPKQPKPAKKAGSAQMTDDDDAAAARQQAIEQARAAGILGESTIKPDPKHAKALYDRGQKLIATACAQKHARTCAVSAAQLDDDAAAYDRACKVGASDACHDLSRFYLATDDKKWIAASTRACELGDFIDCGALSAAYESGENFVKIDAVKSLAFVTKGCDLHDGGACASLAKKEKDPGKSLALFERSCDEGEPFGCEEAGGSYLNATRGATLDAKKGIALYDKACDLEYPTLALYRPICAELAKRYDAGKDVAKDPAKAKELRKKGCARGEKQACKP